LEPGEIAPPGGSFLAVLGVSPPLTGQTSSEGVSLPSWAVFGGGGGAKSSPSAPDAGKTSQNHQEQRENTPPGARFRAVLRVSPLLTWFGPSKNVLGPLRAFFGGLRSCPGRARTDPGPWEALDVRISPSPAGRDLVGRRRDSGRRSPQERRRGADRAEFRGAGGRRDRETALRGALSVSVLPRSGRNPAIRRFPARQAPGWPRSPRSRAAPGPSWGFGRCNRANLGARVTDRERMNQAPGSDWRAWRGEKKTWEQRGGAPQSAGGRGGQRKNPESRCIDTGPPPVNLRFFLKKISAAPPQPASEVLPSPAARAITVWRARPWRSRACPWRSMFRIMACRLTMVSTWRLWLSRSC